MSFSSPVFLLLFLPLFIAAFYLARPSYRNLIIIIASVLFYFWAEPAFIFILLPLLYGDWYLGNKISASRSRGKMYVAAFVVLNVSQLIYFKYMIFFIDNLNVLLPKLALQPLGFKSFLLPLGLSFIVFTKITYSVDIYRGTASPAKSFSAYLLYVLLFPKLIAGPIVKYFEIEKQLKERTITTDDVLYGVYRCSLGLAKKVWCANTLGVVTDKIFAIPASSLAPYQAWLGALCYTLQIYLDFSGYSDMAIGFSRILGFRIKENFNCPYIACSFTEFWRRWHISLSTWIREYLYIPLGGSKISSARTYVNLFICFTLSGMWHGANWTYIVWGMYHGLFLIIDKLFWLKVSKRIPKACGIAITFLLIMVGWVFFRSSSVDYAYKYVHVLFDLPNILNFQVTHFIYFSNDVIFMIVVGCIISFFPAVLKLPAVPSDFTEKALFRRRVFTLNALSLVLFVLSILKISTSNFAAFIYFKF